MGIYSITESVREVKCKQRGKKYTERLCEYIGGSRYWSGKCSCTPTSYDSIAKYIESEIEKFNGKIATNNWNTTLINEIKINLNYIVGKIGKYYKIEEYFYIGKYPSKKAIADYIGKDIKLIYTKYKSITKEELFFKEVLNITQEEYTHYLSYILNVRKNNK